MEAHPEDREPRASAEKAEGCWLTKAPVSLQVTIVPRGQVCPHHQTTVPCSFHGNTNQKLQKRKARRAARGRCPGLRYTWSALLKCHSLKLGHVGPLCELDWEL